MTWIACVCSGIRRRAPGEGGGYRLGAGAVLPPLLLDDDEAVAIAVGLRSATLSGVRTPPIAMAIIAGTSGVIAFCNSSGRAVAALHC